MSKRRRPRRKRTQSTNVDYDNDDLDGPPPTKKPKIIKKNTDPISPQIINDNIKEIEIESEHKQKAIKILIEILLKAKRYEMNKNDLIKQYKTKNNGIKWNINELGPFTEFIINNNDFIIPNTNLRNIRIILSNKHIPIQNIKKKKSKPKPKPKPKPKTMEEINEEKKNLIFSSLDEYEVGERLLTESEQKYLIFGYFREKCYLNIPVVLINCCILYYNDIFAWNVTKHQMMALYNCEAEQEPCSNSFKINNITFYCSLYSPSGKWCILSLFFNSLPQNISEITIHCKLYGVESNILYKNTSVLNPIHNYVEWNRWNMKTSEYIYEDSWTFLCCVQILDIKWNDKSSKMNTYCKPPITLPSHIEYQWNINDTLLNILKSEFLLLKQHDKNYHRDTYHISNYFANNCFSLVCESRIHSWGDPALDLSLCLYRLPERVKMIVVKHKNWVVHNDKFIEEGYVYDKWKGSLSYEDNKGMFNRILHYDPDWKMEQLSFKVKVDIIEVYDLKGNKILKEKWDEYGVILSQNHKQILIDEQKDIMVENVGSILNDMIDVVVYDVERKKWMERKNKKELKANKILNGILLKRKEMYKVGLMNEFCKVNKGKSWEDEFEEYLGDFKEFMIENDNFNVKNARIRNCKIGLSEK
eukprot:142561_1